MGIAGMNAMQAQCIPGHDKRCPSCGVAKETCGHVLHCKEEGHIAVLHRMIDLLSNWMEEHGTATDL
jgi:hypothetical protein